MRRLQFSGRVRDLAIAGFTFVAAFAVGCVGGISSSSRDSREDGGAQFSPAGDDLEDTDAGSRPKPSGDDPATEEGKPTSDGGGATDPAEEPPSEPGTPGAPVSKSVKDITFTNARGDKISARMFVPAGTTTTRHPAVIVLHGSGGLFKDPTSADRAAGRTCSSSMSSQFDRWADRLTARGYVAIFPDSFGSRGYCDEETDSRRADVLPPVPGDENGKTRRLIYRLYDLDAASRYLCTQGRVRCESQGVIGFSNGGSAIALGIHHKLDQTIATFAASSRGKGLGIAIPKMPTPLPTFRAAVAYYPGCGFDGLMPSTTDVGRIEEFLYPRSDLHVLIGSEDSLLEHCSVQAEGAREIQADTYATRKGLPDRYHVKVYNNVGHSFDGAGCEKKGADMSDPDIFACSDAAAITMNLLKKLDTP